jgi:pimeloyl-ACP methyl ester carboxylesterase
LQKDFAARALRALLAHVGRGFRLRSASARLAVASAKAVSPATSAAVALATCLSVLSAGSASAQTCTAIASNACTEWIELAGPSQRALVYRSHPLAARAPAIERALIVVHGGGRNADHMFRTALGAAFLAGALDTTLVIAPRFGSAQGPGCRDALARDEISWACGGWRWGSVAASTDAVTSFDLIDTLVRRLAQKSDFPNLTSVTVAGFSMGGQFVQRYAMANAVHEAPGVRVSYVVGSPSSYAYPDASRLDPADGTFGGYVDALNCAAYNRWPFGLQDRMGYAARNPDAQLRAQLASRPVAYVLGGLDTTPDFGFDTTCPAMAQGTSRLARAQIFTKLLAEKYKVQPRLVVVTACGHSDRCVFTADETLPLLFPPRP